MSEMLALNIYNTFYGRNGYEGVGQAKGGSVLHHGSDHCADAEHSHEGRRFSNNEYKKAKHGTL